VINEPLWLEADEAVEINRKVVEKTNEPFCLLNAGLLKGAIDRPNNLFIYEHEEDIIALACRLLFGIAANHPFAQGNKRTGFHSAIAFMRWNGYVLSDPPDEETIGRMIVQVLEGKLTESQFADRIRPCVVEAV
jgi:death-on-curing protein